MKNILNKKFEELTFEEQMVLALKEALEKFKESDNEEEKSFLFNISFIFSFLLYLLFILIL